MQSKFHKLILVALSVSLCLSALAQDNLPLSSIGYGELTGNNFVLLRSMGGISTAFRDPYNINSANPASYSAFAEPTIPLTTLEVSGYLNWNTVNTASSIAKSNNGGLGYMAIGVPIKKKWWGASIGILPVSRVNYEISDVINFPTIGDVKYDFLGTGGLQKFYFGNGFRVGNFSIGVNVDYIFGTYNIQLQDSMPSSTFISTRSTETVTAKDLTWSTGLQYQVTLKDEVKFTAGVSASLADDIRMDRTNVWERITYVGGEPTVVDVLLDDTAVVSVGLPNRFSVGIGLQEQDHFRVGVQLDLNQWSDYTHFTNTAVMMDETRIAVGGELIPERASDNFFARTAYRLGGHYSTGRSVLAGERIPEYGMTFGFGIPLKRLVSPLSIGFEIGQKGNGSTIVRESYVKFHLGITFNEWWFQKPKID